MDNNDPERNPVDPRTKSLARQVEALRDAKNMSRRQLALQSGVDVTHMSHFLNGKRGMAVGQLMSVLKVLGAALIARPEDFPEPDQGGTIAGTGRLNPLGGHVELPSIWTVEAGFGPFAAGDELTIVETVAWEEDRWLVVQCDGEADIYQAAQRFGLRALLNVRGDTVIFEPERHEIIGRVVKRGQLI